MMTGFGRFFAVGFVFATICAASTNKCEAQQGEPEAGIELLNPLTTFDPTLLESFRQRPLFAPTRRAAPDPIFSDEPIVAVDAPALNIRLLGMVQSLQGAVAMLVDLDDGTRHSVREGETFRNWTVEGIEQTGLTLRQGSKSLALSLFKGAREAADSQEAPAVSVPNALLAPDQPSRQVRIIKPPSRPADATLTDVPGPVEPSAQDIVDFFGPGD